MLFNSYEFIFLFLPFTFFIYFYLNKQRLTEAGKGFLVAMSLVFYSWWNLAYLPLILLSMIFNYSIGVSLTKDASSVRISKKQLLVIGIFGNLSALGYFKYADFFIDNINGLLGSHIAALNLLLPLAISFFTFQQIAYLVDSYKGDTKEYDFLNYAVFVTFFPQLIAGPIVHHREMMPQFAGAKNKIINYRNIALGSFIFSMGLFKKVVVADTLAIWATNGFDHKEILTFVEAWATSLSYTFQLYYDFSGYTDMAIGLALLFNIRLSVNFNSPYKALTIQDFWRRWHITLSRFLKDYVYIPLGGSRATSLTIYRNILITFFIGGIWHGAGWTFIVWGLLHGVALVVHRIWSRYNIRLYAIAAWLVTFNFINFSWIFFRAQEFEDAIKVLEGMAGFHGVGNSNLLNKLGSSFMDDFLLVSVVFVMAFLLIFSKNSMERLAAFRPSAGYAAFTALLFIAALANFQKISEFLYFNF